MFFEYSRDRTRIPNSTLKLLLRLAKTLVKDRPYPANEPVELTLARLEKEIDHVNAAITARVRENNPALTASQAEFDRALDALWVWLRRSLEGLRVYAHPGLKALPKELAETVNLATLRNRAERAAKLHSRLFGSEGTKFVTSSYPEQAESMAALLRLIKEDELGDEIDALVGPELLSLLRTCQIQYEAMVGERMSQKKGSDDDFQLLRARLRALIDHYKNAVETLLDPDDPASVPPVEKALHSIIVVREHMSKARDANTVEELVDDQLEPLGIDVEFAEPPLLNQDGPVPDEGEGG